MRHNLVIILSLFFLVSCNNSRRNKIEEAKAVQKCFENYKTAILNADGKTALNFVDVNTINYYDQMLKYALTAKKEDVMKLTFSNRLMVLSLRHRIDPARLKTMTGKSLFVYTVNNGMIGKTSVRGVEIGRVGTKKKRAKAEVKVRGKKAPYFFYFNRENEQWKIDLTQLRPHTEKALKKMIESLGMNENDYIFQTLGTLTGKEPDESIWKPLS